MSEVHAAVGRVQLRRVEEWTRQRQRNAALFDAELGAVDGLTVPAVADGAVHVYHQYTVRIAEGERDRVREALREEHGVGTGVYYPIPNHRLPSLARFAQDVVLPETERAAREVLSIPVHPSLTPAELDRVIGGLVAVLSAGG
jgi:dTDP-4-amino-4,6-dideoxygalactose transaminase